MPVTYVVYGCHNRHKKGSLVHFYRFPTDIDRRCRWISFVSRINPDGSPWKPGEGDRICSDHFIGKQKSDLLNHPDYTPSVNTIITAATGTNAGDSVYSAEDASGTSTSAALDRFERAKRRFSNKERQQLERDKEEERFSLDLRHACYVFEHDHGHYVKRDAKSYVVEEPMEGPGLWPHHNQITQDTGNKGIPAEVGKHYIYIIII